VRVFELASGEQDLVREGLAVLVRGRKIILLGDVLPP